MTSAAFYGALSHLLSAGGGAVDPPLNQNVALNQLVTASAGVDTRNAPLTAIVDGVTASSPYTNLLVSSTLVSVVVDLGALYNLHQLKVWHYWADGRTYSGTKHEVSADGVNWTVVFDSATAGTYSENSGGHVTNFTKQPVRYIRDSATGSNASGFVEWVEIQIFRTT